MNLRIGMRIFTLYLTSKKTKPTFKTKITIIFDTKKLIFTHQSLICDFFSLNLSCKDYLDYSRYNI